MNIHIIDEFDPEVTAMLQAFYSRSNKPIMERIESMGGQSNEKIKNSLKSWYINYGHSSIGDCGTTTIFLEGVSFYAAKCIQDNALYCGQESSTRYIDFNNADFVNIDGSEEADEINKDWFSIYHKYLPLIREGIYMQHTGDIEEGVTEAVHKKAMDAFAFDCTRCYLPIATKTQLSWHSNLRQIRDKIKTLKYHPSLEVRSLAVQIFEQVFSKYPSAFKAEDIDFYAHEHEVYCEEFTTTFPPLKKEFSTFTHIVETLKHISSDMLVKRPKGIRLPHHYDSLGQVHLQFPLDFGSWRDIQRHRNGVCLFPEINALEIHSWYIEQAEKYLSEEDFNSLKQDIAAVYDKIRKVETSDINASYYLPLGTVVQTDLFYTLPEILYVLELRTQRTVHPTLRNEMRKLAAEFLEECMLKRVGIATYFDFEEGWTSKRGTQDIIHKGA